MKSWAACSPEAAQLSPARRRFFRRSRDRLRRSARSRVKLQSPAGVLTLFSTTTVFGTAVEVTLSELVLEAFYPADELTANVLRQVASSLPK